MSVPFEVIVEPSRLVRRETGSIIGPLVVRAGNVVFPEPGWHDFPVVVLGWWLEKSTRLTAHGIGEFLFMDGPFFFTVHTNRRTEARVCFQERRVAGNYAIAEATTPVASVVSAIESAARDVFLTCQTREWDNRDVERLRQWLA